MNDKQKAAARIRLKEEIQIFIQSDAEVYHFPADLNKLERAIIHDIAESLYLLHFSIGKKKERHIVLRKHPPKLPCGKYFADQDLWVPLEEVGESVVEGFSLMSMNVLFESDDLVDMLYSDIRWSAILDMIGSMVPDIVVLQEVTPVFFEMLKVHEKEVYYLSDVSGESITPSGNLILSKHPLQAAYIYRYTKTPKNVTFGIVHMNGKTLSVGNMHLKAGPPETCARLRRADTIDTMSVQLKQQCDDNIIAGDFNFKSQNEHIGINEDETVHALEDQYTDLWYHIHQNKQRTHTQDNALNYQIAKISLKDEKLFNANRFDRIYMKKKPNETNTNWQCKNINFIGNTPIQKAKNTNNGETFDLYMSDHYGLLATFTATQT